MKEKKKIISLGFDFPGDDVEYVDYLNDKSLTDADIIVCTPHLSILNSLLHNNKYAYNTVYKKFKYFKSHWEKEFREVLSLGRTIFIFLDAPYYIEDLNAYSYNFLPFIHIPNIASGSTMTMISRPDYLKEYWFHFKKNSKYTAYFEKNNTPYKTIPLIYANSPNRIVGGIYVESESIIIFLPSLIDNLFYKDTDKTSDWSKEKLKLGNILANCFRNIDDSFQAFSKKTIPPDWISDSEFSLVTLTDIDIKIDDTNKQIEALQKEIESLEKARINEGKLLYLLYETGDHLEESVIEALKILGFDAEKVITEKEEYDVKFSSPEGRFIGEIEGKDNKSINIDKLRQLFDKVEDDQENSIDGEYSIGVLFGNAFRFEKPSERTDYFTEKCMQKVKGKKFVLVPTPYLFSIARYVKEHNDNKFADQCREAFFNSQGKIVSFPPIPNKKSAS